ncbi:MAG: OmpA family protein, partial [Chthoniobacterales bacterium]|nr:OmpA family protein [Chthoniobacterales bacterium]
MNSAEIRPQSEPALAEILKLLKENAGRKDLVVGHTDAVGCFEYNRVLSKRGAETEVNSLTSKGISLERLF